MLVRAPLVEAKQDSSIRIQDLTKVLMSRRRLGLAEERLVPFEAAGNVAYTNDGPRAFHCISSVGLTRKSSAAAGGSERSKLTEFFHKSKVRIGTASGWLQRLVRRVKFTEA